MAPASEKEEDFIVKGKKNLSEGILSCSMTERVDVCADVLVGTYHFPV